MNAVLEEPMDDTLPLIEVCKGGVVLCQLLNRIAELLGTAKLVKKIHPSTTAFKARPRRPDLTGRTTVPLHAGWSQHALLVECRRTRRPWKTSPTSSRGASPSECQR